MTVAQENKLALLEAPRTHDKIVQERLRIGKRALELRSIGLNKNRDRTAAWGVLEPPPWPSYAED